MIEIDGHSLDLASFAEMVLRQRPVGLAANARAAVELPPAPWSRALLASDQPAYAITTGVGKLSDVRIAPASRTGRCSSTCCARTRWAWASRCAKRPSRGMMLLRANSLARGNSGVRAAVIEALVRDAERGVHPVIPSQGSVGASGDLAPLAHLALVLIGEGEAWFESQAHERRRGDARPPASLRWCSKPRRRSRSSTARRRCWRAARSRCSANDLLADTADALGAASLDALKGTVVALDERIHQARPHPGQIQSAANLRRMLAGES